MVTVNCIVCMLNIAPVCLIDQCVLCHATCLLNCIDASLHKDNSWLCHDCTKTVPYMDFVNTKDSLAHKTISENLVDDYLDPIEYYNDGRVLLNEEDLNADLNCLNSTSTFSSSYKDLEQLHDFSKSLKYSDQFSFAHINCRSLNSKLPEISLLLSQINISVLALTETWLNDNLASTVNIPGYSFIHCSRLNGIRGGVGFFIRSDIEFCELIGIPGYKLNAFESIFIKLPQKTSSDIILGSIYRPPGNSISEFISDFHPILHYLTKTNKRIFIAGDFNINILKLDEHHPTGNFLNIMASFKFIPAILRPTRITEFTATLIDNIYTNSNQTMDSCILIEDIDHLPIILFIEHDYSTCKLHAKSSKRNFSEQNIKSFIASLQSIDWSVIEKIVSTDGPGIAYSAFINLYKSAYDSAFPVVTAKFVGKSNGPKQPWMSPALFKSF